MIFYFKNIEIDLKITLKIYLFYIFIFIFVFIFSIKYIFISIIYIYVTLKTKKRGHKTTHLTILSYFGNYIWNLYLFVYCHRNIPIKRTTIPLNGINGKCIAGNQNPLKLAPIIVKNVRMLSFLIC